MSPAPHRHRREACGGEEGCGGLGDHRDAKTNSGVHAPRSVVAPVRCCSFVREVGEKPLSEVDLDEIEDLAKANAGKTATLTFAIDGEEIGDVVFVFYAEDGASWVHFEPVIRALATTHGRGVCYLTSSPRDPVLEREDEAVRAFYIGDGACRTFLLRILEAGVVVMTMPDLETFHIKRSKYPVHYIYLHHSIVSTHMIYRRGAFDGFDTVFCVGPHHLAEIRETEALYGLKPKLLVEHGYGRLDSITAAAKASPTGLFANITPLTGPFRPSTQPT